MGKGGKERMEEYEKRLGPVAIPTTSISGSGRFSIPGLGDGRVSGVGHISPDKIKVSGSSELPGGIKVGSLTVSGSTMVRGDLEAGAMNFSGSATIHGALIFGQLRGSGSIRADGDARGGSMHVSGSCKIGGGIDLEGILVASGSLETRGDVAAKESVELDGVFEVDGKLKTKTLDASLSYDRSRVGEGIEAERVDIRKGGGFERIPRLAARIFGWGDREGDLYTTDITGKANVYLENVICDNVVGGKVTIGEGCEVKGTVRYTETVEIHPDARVQNPPEKVNPSS
jgi:hypothetical protein